jgi:hypothetical protein
MSLTVPPALIICLPLLKAHLLTFYACLQRVRNKQLIGVISMARFTVEH